MSEKSDLIDEHKNLIEQQVHINSKLLPETFVRTEAYRIANQAADSFDPDSGNKFSTYLTHQLHQLSRLNTQYGSSARLPEGKQFKINQINHVEKNLAEKLDREPSTSELADAMGLPINEIDSLLKDRKTSVNLSALPTTPIFQKENDDWVHYVYHDLPERDKVIFEHKTGFGGKPILSNGEIAKKLNITSSLVSNRLKMITDQIEQVSNKQ